MKEDEGSKHKLKGRFKRATTGRGVDLAERWNNEGIKLLGLRAEWLNPNSQL